MADITFLDEAIEDLERLDWSALRLVLGKLRILRRNPDAGQPLGRRRVGNLTGFRKLVVGDRQYRIVYKIEPDGDICVIWVVAGRIDDECYDLALARLREHGDHPHTQDLTEVISVLKRPSAARQLAQLISESEDGH